MGLSFADILNLNKKFEGQTFDRKSKGILSHAEDLTVLMVAFGNNFDVPENYGGIIVIGIDDDGNFEQFEPKQGHEELIMTIASERIYPSIIPQFEILTENDKNVYAITIPKMTNTPYALITPKGFIYKKRVGSTIQNATIDDFRHVQNIAEENQAKKNIICSIVVILENMLEKVNPYRDGKEVVNPTLEKLGSNTIGMALASIFSLLDKDKNELKTIYNEHRGLFPQSISKQFDILDKEIDTQPIITQIMISTKKMTNAPQIYETLTTLIKELKELS